MSSYFRYFVSDCRFLCADLFSDIRRQYSACVRHENEKLTHWKRRWKNCRFQKKSFLAVKGYISVISSLSWVQICIWFQSGTIFTLKLTQNVDPVVKKHLKQFLQLLLFTSLNNIVSRHSTTLVNNSNITSYCSRHASPPLYNSAVLITRGCFAIPAGL